MLNNITLFFYSAGTIAQFMMLFRRDSQIRFIIPLLAIPAVMFHAYLLYRWIDLSSGQNLTEFNLFSLATWVTGVLILLMGLKKPTDYLTLLIFPLAVLSILLATHFPSSHIIKTATMPKQFWHILLSVATFSVLSLAGLQAFTLAIQERIVKHKHFEISRALPPIETMEKFLFQIVAVGVALLTLLLASSLFSFQDILLEQFWKKTVLAFLSWLVLITLLIGRYCFGWRGKKAIYCTLGGVTLLTIIYFSSMIIMEFYP